jgi:FKBP-type peptidyl-prolyl cis-trans isomerase FkpA
MGNTKIIIISGIAVAIMGLLVAGAGFFIQHNKGITHAASSLAKTVAAQNDDNAPVTQPALTDSGNGLSGINGSDQSVPQETQNSQLGQSGSGIDPSTFSKYDQYKSNTAALFADIQKGTGDELTINKKAAVVYKGWLTNGQLFDQSRADSNGQLQPFGFTLGAHQVITGWEQGMAGMKVGGTRLLIIPPSVGYGAAGQGSIPPNSVLVFQVQLLAVQ